MTKYAYNRGTILGEYILKKYGQEKYSDKNFYYGIGWKNFLEEIGTTNLIETDEDPNKDADTMFGAYGIVPDNCEPILIDNWAEAMEKINKLF